MLIAYAYSMMGIVSGITTKVQATRKSQIKLMGWMRKRKPMINHRKGELGVKLVLEVRIRESLKEEGDGHQY